jgi:hypothetical protein
VELDPDFEAIVTIGGHKSGATLRLARLRNKPGCGELHGGDGMLVEPDPVDGPGQRAAVLPISSGNSPRTGGLAVLLKGAGTKATGVARRDQPRALDVGCRHKPPRSRFAAPSWAPGLRHVEQCGRDGPA